MRMDRFLFGLLLTFSALMGSVSKASTQSPKSCRLVISDLQSLKRFPDLVQIHRSLVKQPKSDRTDRFKLWYLSHFFFNRDKLLRQRLTRPEDLYPREYNRDGENPFLGYINARDFLFETSLNDVLSLPTILNTHRILMDDHPNPALNEMGKFSTRNSEETLEIHLGKIRSEGVFYPYSADQLVQRPLEHISKDEHIKSPRSKKALLATNPYLSIHNNEVQYAFIGDWKKFESILSARLKDKLEKMDQIPPAERPVVIQRYLTELIENLLKRFKKEMSSLDLKSENRDKLVIERVAQFLYEYVSIHPHANGNGRIARLLAERILSHFDLPPPIWTHAGWDVTLSMSEFIKVLSDSIYLSKILHSQLVNRNHKDLLNFEDVVPALLAPMDLISHPEIQIDNLSRHTVLSSKEFIQFRKSCTECVTEEVSIEIYLKWVRKVRSHLQFSMHDSTLQLVPQSYIDSFAMPFENSSQRVSHLNKYYVSEGGVSPSIYRGVVIEKKLSLNEVLGYFTKVSSATVGNGIALSTQAVRSRLNEFNKIAVDYNRARAWYDGHLKGVGQKYLNSGISSWSKSEQVSLDFAQFHFATFPEASTVLIESYIPKYTALDAELVTKQMKLKNEWPDENEVSIIGAVGPVAIKSVKIMTGSKQQDGVYRIGPDDLHYQARRNANGFIEVLIFKSDSQQFIDPQFVHWIHIKTLVAEIDSKGQIKLKN